MNRLRGRIAAVESNGHMSLVDVTVGADAFTALLLETPQDAPYLVAGNAVDILFKETEVSLAKNLSGEISLRNRVRGIVRDIRRGTLLSEVVLDCHEHAISSVITSRAAARLNLQVGDAVEALVKANEVSLAEVSDGV